MFIPLLILLTLGLFIVSLVLFFSFYRKYYKHMKSKHIEHWKNLMNKDPVVELAGEWIRWPVGSIYLLLSIFNLSESYSDEKVRYYKKYATFFFTTSIILFLLNILMISFL